MGAEAINKETQAVLNSINGVRTKEQLVCEYFGVQPSDLGKTVKLKRAGVRWYPKLATFGFTLADFKEMFADTLELDDNGNPITNDAGRPEQARSEVVDTGAGADAGVEAPVKQLKRRKKGSVEEVPGTEPVSE
jgi:hypothetical protein